ncbi:uncharacterized protein SCODWIG_00580 [Saccharomycodes ludwigii]|uniref:Uncharacterized protein n=1 Tax=Saccharomycodes ludwigii TaxID=36035 RepID=A0A376B2I3_9ASCO|nr:hypothetical protein SCDLUD_004480 [Saccharomycodes ludwigii]KAH3899058.1 hypothetical protein SCDLUD_004480 [Saccharomycodes ludwigii]SSD58819.1 uncharacterized protein SCODWIG_00580 [Saccharomycodes ludwigii]
MSYGVYIRGPLCGVDNCRSKLWRVIDGRRTCQYGHVMENDYEFNDDEDEGAGGVAITRRLNLTTDATGNFQSSQLNMSQFGNSQHDSDLHKVYGKEARLLFLKSFQYILKIQTRDLIKTFQLPTSFELLIKKLWCEYLINSQQRKHSNKGDNGKEEKKEEQNDDDDEEFKGLELSLMTGICLLYIGCVNMKLPIFSNDFSRMVLSMDLLYINANKKLPMKWRKQLPNHFLSKLEGSKIWSNAQFYNKLGNVCDKLNIHGVYEEINEVGSISNVNNVDKGHKILWKNFLCRLTVTYLFPSFVYRYCVKLIEYLDDKNTFGQLIGFNSSSHFVQYQLFPEIRCICYFILTLRLCLLDNDTLSQDFISEWLAIQTMGGIKFIEPYKLIHSNAKDLLLLQTLGKNNSIDGDRIIDEYIDFVEDRIMNKIGYGRSLYERKENSKIDDEFEDEFDNFKLDQKIVVRKLYNLVPLKNDKDDGDYDNKDDRKQTDNKYMDKIQLLYAQLSSVPLKSIDNIPREEKMGLLEEFENKLLELISNDFLISVKQLRNSLKHLQKGHFSIKK